jgi:tetratricopeptide (TPR) repeat protein
MRLYIILLFLFSCSTAVINQPPGHKVASVNHLENGKRQLEKGHCKQAIEQFDKALEKDPTNFQALYWKGVALGMCGDYSSAIKILEVSIKYKPSNIWDERINIAISICNERLSLKGKGKKAKSRDFSIVLKWLWEQ